MHGHYKSMLVMDEDWARQKLDYDEADEADRLARGEPIEDREAVSPLGYDPQLAYLATIADRLLGLRNTLIAVNSSDGKEPSFDPLPRPVTALDREREKRTRNELLDLDALLRGLP